MLQKGKWWPQTRGDHMPWCIGQEVSHGAVSSWCKGTELLFSPPTFSPRWLSREAGKYYCAKTPTTLTPVQIKETQPKQFQAWSNSLQEKNAYLRSYPLAASNYRDSLRSSHIKKKKKNVVIPIFLCWKISCSFPFWNLILTLKPCWVRNQTFTRSRIKKGGLTKPKT